MRTLIKESNGESWLWWHTVDRAKQSGERRFAKQVYIHCGRQCYSFYLSLFTSLAMVGLTFSTTGDENFHFSLAIYKLFYFGFSIAYLPIVGRLPGVKWAGKWGSGEREFRLSWRPWSWHWNIWTYPHESKNWWRDGHFDLADFLLGREKHTAVKGEKQAITVSMPEGDYQGTVEIVHRSWKRPRWPTIKRRVSADIEMAVPIPVPGDGENDWDCGDDAIYGGSYSASTAQEAIDAIRNSALRQRSK